MPTWTTTFACVIVSVALLGCGSSDPSSANSDPLAKLPQEERSAVEQLLTGAGLSAKQLRPVGRLGIEKNSQSIVVENGHVKALRISDSPLASMRAVAALPELEVLWLTNNKISEIDGLETARKLTVLVLSRNQIRTVDRLAGATLLETLSLNDNRIEKLVDIPTLSALHTLDISDNQLVSLEGLGGLPKLWTVRAKGNPLNNAEAVRAVRTRGGVLELPESVAAVALGVNAARPAGESVSTFVMNLRATNGIKVGQENFDARSTGQIFEYSGRMKSLSGAARLGLVEGTNPSSDPVTIEVKVTSGRVRVYLADLNGFRYVETRPEQPARLTGRLMLGLNYYTVIESLEGEAAGLAWRVYRK
jgi:hypothetical protein